MLNLGQLTQGETLMILQKRSELSVDELAKMLEVHPNHLSKVFKSKIVSAKLKSKACKIFNVPESIFNDGYFDGNTQIDVVAEPKAAYVPNTGLTAADVMKYLEEKDRRHYAERDRLLGIIEALSRK